VAFVDPKLAFRMTRRVFCVVVVGGGGGGITICES
jgi:hypothetical protein